MVPKLCRCAGLLTLFWLTGCTITLPFSLQRPTPTPSVPAIEPVRVQNGLERILSIDFSASTNCAEVGATVIFTVQITNDVDAPVTFIDKTPIEIELKPAGPGEPTLRWSQTDQYPKNIQPVLTPHETRTYVWHWVADAVYAQQQRLDLNGVLPTITVGPIMMGGNTIPEGSLKIYVGVGSMALSRPTSGIHCSEMRH